MTESYAYIALFLTNILVVECVYVVMLQHSGVCLNVGELLTSL